MGQLLKTFQSPASRGKIFAGLSHCNFKYGLVLRPAIFNFECLKIPLKYTAHSRLLTCSYFAGGTVVAALQISPSTATQCCSPPSMTLRERAYFQTLSAHLNLGLPCGQRPPLQSVVNSPILWRLHHESCPPQP